jgi:predicted Zn-dependent protease
MLINEAFQTLNSPVSRKEYDRNLGLGVAQKVSIEHRPAATAAATPGAKEEPRAGVAQRLDDKVKKAIMMADRMCEQGNFWQAADSLHRLLSRYPRQPNLRRALARATSGMMRHREAAEHLKVACEVEYFNSENHLLLGEAYMRGKQWTKARDALRDALSWNEDSERAKRDLEAIQKELDKDQSVFRKIASRLTQSMKKPEAGKNAPKRK